MIQVSEKASQEIKRLQAQDPDTLDKVLRIRVIGGGCSGMSYELGFDKIDEKNDQVFESAGVKLGVDKRSLLFLSGTTLDFVGGLSGKAFVFNNPKAKRSCGCGSSFSV